MSGVGNGGRGPGARPPHPATVVQRSSPPGFGSSRPPHPAKVAQPRSVPARSVQRASLSVGHVNIPVFGGTGTMSANQNYFIPDDFGGQVIYATSQPRASVIYNKSTAPQVTYNSKTYDSYVSWSFSKTGKFVKDCLHTAEEINAGKELKPGNVTSKVAGTSVAFGEDDKSNIQLAKRCAVDDAAAPTVGQAYAIVNTAWPKGATSPYHAAAVVAVDGDDRITVEVFASMSDGRRTEQHPPFAMYSTGSGTLPKFHSHWVAQYFKTNANTIVIEPK